MPDKNPLLDLLIGLGLTIFGLIFIYVLVKSIA